MTAVVDSTGVGPPRIDRHAVPDIDPSGLLWLDQVNRRGTDDKSHIALTSRFSAIGRAVSRDADVRDEDVGRRSQALSGKYAASLSRSIAL